MIGDNFRMTVDNLNGLRIEEIDDLVEQSLYLQRKDASPEEFNRCLEELYVKATSRASADALTGGASDIHSPVALATVLENSTSTQQNVFAHPAFSHVNLLSRYIEGNFQDFKHAKLVNPLIWIKLVDTILHMLAQKLEHDVAYPATEHARDLDIQKLLLLKKHGEQITAFIEQLHKNKYVQHIAQVYQQRLQQLANMIEQEQKSFEAKQTQQLCKEHHTFIDSEKMKSDGLPDTYECKHCMAYIADTIRNARIVYDSPYMKPHQYHFRGNPIVYTSDKELRRTTGNTLTDLGPSTTVEEVRNFLTFLKVFINNTKKKELTMKLLL